MLTPKVFPVLQQAIEEGVLEGYRLAHSEVEPDEILLVETIVKCTIRSVLDHFDIDGKSTAS